MSMLYSFLSDPYGFQHAKFQEEREQKALAKKIAQEQATPAISEMSYFEDPYGQEGSQYKSGFTKVKKNLKGVARGVSYLPQDILGGFTDLSNLVLTPIGLGSQRPVGGSDWMIDKGHQVAPQAVAKRTGELDEFGGRVLSSLINPAGVVRGVARGVEKAAPHIAQAGQAAISDIARGSENLQSNMFGVPRLAEAGIPRGMRNPEGSTSAGGPLYAIKPEGGNWIRDPKNITDKYVTKPKFNDTYDEWLSRHPEQLEDNGVREHAWDIALTRRAEIEANLSPRDKETVNRYRDVNEQIEMADSGEHPEFDSNTLWMDKEALENKMIREIPMSIEDRVAMIFNPHGGDEMGDASEFYLRKAGDEIAKEAGIPTLSDFITSKEPATKWGSEVVPKFMEKKYGTPSDPLFKAFEEGRAKHPGRGDNELSKPAKHLVESRKGNQAEFTKLGQEPPPVKGSAKTPAGRIYENAVDNSINYVKLSDLLDPEQVGQYGGIDKAKFPWINESTPKDTTFYSVANNPYLDNTLTELNREAKALVDEGKMTDANYKKWTVDQVAVESTNRRLAKEKLEGASQEAIEGWAQERYQTLPVAKELANGGKIVRFNKANSAGNPELLKRDLSLQTCILEHCVGSAGQNDDGTKYLSMVSPATGEKTKGSSGTGLGYGYHRKVLSGEQDIATVFDNKGIPHGTVLFDAIDNPRPFEAGKYNLSQIRGFDNGKIPTEYLKDFIAYFNDISGEIYKVKDLDMIGAKETNSSDLFQVLRKQFAGESDVKANLLVEKLVTAVKAEAKKNGDKREIGQGNVMERMLETNNLRFISTRDYKAYKNLLSKYLNR